MSLGAVVGCVRLPQGFGQQQRLPRIGFVSAGLADYPAPLGTPHVEEFRDALRELGYVEGRNLQGEYRFAELRFGELPALVAELVDLPVDVIVLGDTRSITPVKQATSTIPVVMVLSTDPVASGHVESLARPGGNMTGLTMAPLETMGKRLDLLRDALPAMSHAALLYNPEDRLAARASAEVGRIANQLGLSYQPLEVRQPEDLAPTFERASRTGVDGLVVFADTLINAHAQRVAELALTAGLPSVGMTRAQAEAGLLMAYAPSLPALFRRAAVYVQKIINGAKPADLPVERPTRFELVFNLRTAGALGLQIERPFLSQITDVIQ